MNGMIKEAFFKICKDAKPATSKYVSLYTRSPYYGGPEEGGWWGHDDILIAHYQCEESQAEEIYGEIMKIAAELNQEAKNNFERQCLNESKWLESRGLDDTFLPEVDGEVSYYVTIEDTPGQNEKCGTRHYE